MRMLTQNRIAVQFGVLRYVERLVSIELVPTMWTNDAGIDEMRV
jgi:hypothetical protein